MKTHSLTYLGGLAAVLAATAGIALQPEIDFASSAEAGDTQLVTVECGATTVTASVPTIKYTLTFPSQAGQAFNASKVQITGSLEGTGINSDGAPSPTKASDVAGYATLIHAAPLSKIGGLQCQTSASFAKLEVRGVDNSADLDIAAEDATATNWQAANQVDNANKTLFGGGAGIGLISGSHLEDGQDHDTLKNGEIVFGGSTQAGRHSLVSLVKYVDTTLANASETLTYTFTPQANAQ